MPATAAIVDWLRADFGASVIDAAIANGQRLRRAYLRMVEERGQSEADAWLARQRPAGGTFWAGEAGLEVGVQRGEA